MLPHSCRAGEKEKLIYLLLATLGLRGSGGFALAAVSGAVSRLLVAVASLVAECRL